MSKWFDANGVDVDAYPERAFRGGVYATNRQPIAVPTTAPSKPWAGTTRPGYKPPSEWPILTCPKNKPGKRG